MPPLPLLLQAIMDVLSPAQQLFSLAPRQHTHLACALLARGGGITPADMSRGVGRLRQQIRMAPYNAEGGVRTGLCSRPTPGALDSVSCDGGAVPHVSI